MAIRAGAGVLTYLHGDHLGSVNVATNTSGALASPVQEFDPWGAVRAGGVSQTTRNYTGQRLDSTGLLYYHARYYDPALGRFVSPDTPVPGAEALNATASGRGQGPVNPQQLNRYSYVLNNPINKTDPTGHEGCVQLDGGECGGGAEVSGGGGGGGGGGIDPYKDEREAVPSSTGQQGSRGGQSSTTPGVNPAETAARASNTGQQESVASNPATAANQRKALASQQQMQEEGRVIAGENARRPFRDAEQIAERYGGRSQDWEKRGSSSYDTRDGLGTSHETHWVENRVTGQREEFKTKILRPLEAPRGR